jgi:hypothetical protein
MVWSIAFRFLESTPFPLNYFHTWANTCHTNNAHSVNIFLDILIEEDGLWAWIRDAFGWNIGRDTGCPKLRFLYSPQSLDKFWDSTMKGYDRFLPNAFQFRIYLYWCQLTCRRMRPLCDSHFIFRTIHCMMCQQPGLWEWSAAGQNTWKNALSHVLGHTWNNPAASSESVGGNFSIFSL